MNKVFLLGNVGRHIDLRTTQAGQAVCNFTLATSRKRKDKPEETQWHNIVAWGKAAEILAEYASKGKQVCIEGHLQTRQFQDKQGATQYRTEIVVEEFKLLGGAGAAAAPAPVVDLDIPY